MPTVHVKRSIEINATPDKVYKAINDFNNWSKWSPWLILEPGINNSVSDNAKYNEWEGPRSGAGNMTVTAEKENERIDIDLVFLKPWKSKAKIFFEINAKGDSTEVSWNMENKLPFFMFFMKGMLETYVGMDFERGLRLMKDFVEDGEAHSKLDFIGNENFAGINYIGIRTSCTKATMGKKMAEDLPKLMEFINDKGLAINGPIFTQYEKWDMRRDNIRYVSGAAVNTISAELPTGFISGTIPACTVNTVQHTGPYHHLGNAWSAMYSMMRNKEFKSNKKIYAFETYHNKPGEVSDNELITKIHFPTR